MRNEFGRISIDNAIFGVVKCKRFLFYKRANERRPSFRSTSRIHRLLSCLLNEISWWVLLIDKTCKHFIEFDWLVQLAAQRYGNGGAEIFVLTHQIQSSTNDKMNNQWSKQLKWKHRDTQRKKVKRERVERLCDLRMPK